MGCIFQKVIPTRPTASLLVSGVVCNIGHSKVRLKSYLRFPFLSVGCSFYVFQHVSQFLEHSPAK